MTPQSTGEIFQALHEHREGPLKLKNPNTGEVCWILSESQMERFRSLFETDPFSTEEKRFLLRKAGERAGWDDPEMDAYDNYDEHAQP